MILETLEVEQVSSSAVHSAFALCLDLQKMEGWKIGG